MTYHLMQGNLKLVVDVIYKCLPKLDKKYFTSICNFFLLFNPCQTLRKCLWTQQEVFEQYYLSFKSLIYPIPSL